MSLVVDMIDTEKQTGAIPCLAEIKGCEAAVSVRDSSRNGALDALKLLACCGVLLIHCLRNASPDHSVEYHPFLYYSFRFAIPVFFMVNGYFQLNKPAVSWRYSVSKALGIACLMVGWITLCNVVRVLLGREFVFADYWEWSWTEGSFGVFWFFGAFLILTVFLPVLIRLFQCRKGRLSVLAGLFTVCVSMDAVSMCRIHDGGMFVQEAIPQMLRLWTWLFYFFLGGEVGELYRSVRGGNKIPRSVCAWAVVPLTVGAVAWQYAACYEGSGCINSEYMYDNPVVIAWCASIMVVVLSVRLPRIVCRPISELSACGLAVYAMHMMILRMLVAKIDFASWGMNWVLITALIVLCFPVALVLRRIPGLWFLTTISFPACKRLFPTGNGSGARLL